MKSDFERYRNYPVLNQAGVLALLPQYRAGDEEAGRLIIEGNIRLVVYVVANRFWRDYKREGATHSADDLMQEGILGLHRALELYNPAKARFSTYATMWIRHEIQTALGQVQPTVSLDESCPDGDGAEYSESRLEMLPDRFDLAGEFDQRAHVVRLSLEVHQALGQIDPSQAVVLALRNGIPFRGKWRGKPFRCDAGGPATLAEVGSLLGVSHQWIWQIEIVAKRQLKAALLCSRAIENARSGRQ